MSYRDDVRAAQKETLWTLPRIVFLVLIVMVAMYGLGFVATGGNLAIYRFWAPKQANAERVVFQNTQSYVQGKTEYLNQLRLDYETADGRQKEALRRTILTEASTVDNSKLPVDLQSFVASLKGNL
jgi:hypothetical protein